MFNVQIFDGRSSFVSLLCLLSKKESLWLVHFQFSLVYHSYRSAICLGMLFFSARRANLFNYDTIDDTIKSDKFLIYPIVLASERMQISSWSLILPIRRQLSLTVPYNVQVFGLTGEESNSVWTPPSCVVTTTEAPTTTPIPATTLTKYESIYVPQRFQQHHSQN